MKDIFDIVAVKSETFIGRTLGNVTLLKELGRGGKGIVFIAFQKSLKRQVAVKILPKLRTTSEIHRMQFRDEAEIVAVLSHANIIPIFEMGEDDDLFYQVMQLVSGSDLKQLIVNQLKHPVPTRRRLPVEQTFDIMLQILDGLGYAHEEGVIHQDIKPSNILIEGRSKRPLIADFGIAKTAQMEYTMENVIIGSPVYLSPEQASAQPTDNRTDIYSAGIMLMELFAGHLPRRDENTQQILIRKIKQPETFFTVKPSEASASINKDLERIILKAIEPDKEKRYKDCFTFKDELQWYYNTFVRNSVHAIEPTEGL